MASTAIRRFEQRLRKLSKEHLGLALLFHDIDPSINSRQAHAVGSFQVALLAGVMAQR
jgi:hypothetical protein